MNHTKKIILAGLLTIAVVGAGVQVSQAQVNSAVGGQSLWKMVSGAIQPMVSSWTLGDSSNRISEGWFTLLNATSLTVAGTATGALNMGGYNITNGGTITGTTLSATSTTGTSTFSGGATFATSAGNVGIASTTPWKTFSVVGTGAWNGLTNAPATASSICIDAATNELYDNAATSCLVSARRFKYDIVDQGNAMSTIMSLRPRLYKSKSDKSEHYGFIAEEVEEVDKRFVDYNKDGTTQSVRYQEMVSLLTKGMQEQQAIIEKLEKRIEAL